MKEKAIAILSLFASTSTLLCCALPTLLVTLGLGAVVAGAVSSLPWLVPLSRHKAWVFLGSGLLIAVNWLLILRGDRRAACAVPADGPPSACQVAGRFSRVVLWVSSGLYVVGFVVAYLAFPLGETLGWW
ncbi:MAG: hypothetical protein D6795_17115 [Deltaproteobacteria bacterium]|nr:MAG: hypothetical protein D6795_17115 [Deltaproteobacteria bacterium]